MTSDEKTVKSMRVYSGRIIDVDLDEVELAEGKITKREIVHHNGGAAILFVRDGDVALAEQYRYAYKKVLTEIPAGKIEKGEAPKACAIRELEEEMGYVADDAKLYLTVYPTPGYTDEIIYVYLVENAKFKAQKLDSGEYLNCKFMKIKDVLCMIESGEICDSKTICALYRYACEHNLR
ncbi:MAG: NUDIX hydrolase [Bacteroidales bacterium]|nr:NUDIX hydrolase [Bacteroidales bacterium]